MKNIYLILHISDFDLQSKVLKNKVNTFLIVALQFPHPNFNYHRRANVLQMNIFTVTCLIFTNELQINPSLHINT